jgi:hypothetical protein
MRNDHHRPKDWSSVFDRSGAQYRRIRAETMAQELRIRSLKIGIGKGAVNPIGKSGAREGVTGPHLLV